MRVVVLIIALIGAVTSGFLGYKWFSDSRTDEVKLSRQLYALAAEGGDEGAKAKLAELDRLVTASYFLMAGFALGIAGGILAYSGRGMIAAIILLVAGAAPGFLAPKSLVFSCPLLLAGLLSFLVRPTPAGRVRV